LLARPGRAAGVRRWAEQVEASADGDILTLRYAEPHGLAAWLVRYGTDVHVLEPAEVRDAIVCRLRDMAGMAEKLAVPGERVDADRPAEVAA
ncbi:MAG: WYL domain-containing protein, partial [Hamadaea sp.]|nr:WYL domain-containing protein [Hamadaea sp.]